ncbi:MAG: tRNA (adenosine(37)-N6)-threonylcarbamoyltransferase complex ATPase subunit type 1 TsaE [Firmicutes bacterium]|nr:tRNA (adenosine(37)-N6)-threonylcarbamoyltransferase complex ATPase subunit type 1 TsaE [Bacillota bacterium]
MRQFSERRISIKGVDEMRELGLELAAALEPGDIIAMVGNLGTGKTTLSKYIAEGLGVTEALSSPTFNIVKEYRSGRLPLFHFDVYRLSSGDDLVDIGAEDYLYGDGVCLIEWADIVADILPEETIVIRLEYGENEGAREVTIC